MREIKFRGKRTDNKEWVYGSLDLCGDTPFMQNRDVSDTIIFRKATVCKPRNALTVVNRISLLRSGHKLRDVFADVSPSFRTDQGLSLSDNSGYLFTSQHLFFHGTGDPSPTYFTICNYANGFSVLYNIPAG